MSSNVWNVFNEQAIINHKLSAYHPLLRISDLSVNHDTEVVTYTVRYGDDVSHNYGNSLHLFPALLFFNSMVDGITKSSLMVFKERLVSMRDSENGARLFFDAIEFYCRRLVEQRVIASYDFKRPISFATPMQITRWSETGYIPNPPPYMPTCKLAIQPIRAHMPLKGWNGETVFPMMFPRHENVTSETLRIITNILARIVPKGFSLSSEGIFTDGRAVKL